MMSEPPKAVIVSCLDGACYQYFYWVFALAEIHAAARLSDVLAALKKSLGSEKV